MNFHVEREGDVVPQNLESPFAEEVSNVCPGAGVEAVHAHDLVAVFEKPFAEV